MNLRAWVQSALSRAYKLTVPKEQGKGWLNAQWRDLYKPNWFQLGMKEPTQQVAMSSSAVYACVSIISQEVSRLDLHHFRINPDKSRDLQIQSAASRVFRDPNWYQTPSDFLLFMMQSLLLSGNAYAVVIRDGTGAVSELHPQFPDHVNVQRVQGSTDYFYMLGSNNGPYDIANLQEYTPVPARDMLHIRLFPSSDILLGSSPLQALGPSVAMAGAIQHSSAAFFQNMARPSGIIASPKKIDPIAADRLKKQWKDTLSGTGAGGVVVFDGDASWHPLTMNAVDSEVIAQYKLSVENIAQVYRVPMFMLGDLSKATFSNVESLQKAFIMSTLGFYLKHVENAYEDLFNMGPNERVEFDLERGLMRPDLEQRMSAYAKGVLGGIYAPNEPRARENLPPVEGGDRVYMQRQNWPLELLGEDAEPTETEPAPDEPAEDETVSDEEIRAIFRSVA